MMREFQRGVQLETVMERTINSPTKSVLEKDFVRILSGNMSKGPRGTIQDAAQSGSTSEKVQLGPIGKSAHRVNNSLQKALLQLYNWEEPHVHFGSEDIEGTETLHMYIRTYQHAFLSGRKIIPCSLHGYPVGSSLIQALFDNVPYAGEVLYIFSHRQPGVNVSHNEIFAAVHWMVPSKWSPLDNTNLWSSFPELGIETWKFNKFFDLDTNLPPMIIPFKNIQCQVSRCKVTHTDPHLWITTTMDRFITPAIAAGFTDDND
ncbi:unnamed protein product [Mycena citricolor]|uniref:Uncharacterized protein n=1 Tax=Mycena citricolor TaxID=2018698 RepID=A0AAD2GY40_9AGAR|nr:unnamed protein product [Mycena citricolor]